MKPTAKDYRDAAQVSLHNAHAAMAHADRSRLEGCHESRVRYLNNAARYRKAYQHRMQQAQETEQ